MADLQKRAGAAEKEMAKKFDVVINNVAYNTFGMTDIPWFRLTVYLAFIDMILVCLTMFMRADFINLTICCVALHMVLEPDNVERDYFRYLVLGLVMSLFFDIFWLFIKSGEYHTELNTEDGGVETSIRRFSLYVSYFSLIFRVFMALVFWKDSIDFDQIIRGHARGGGSSGRMGSSGRRSSDY
jgi:hypothetical protein